jgi:hypothetical protein
MPVVHRVGELGADVRDRQVETRFERVNVARGLGGDQVALQSGEGAEGELVDVGPGTQFPALLHAAQPVPDGCLLTAVLVAGMLTRGRGSIVNVSTMAASMGVAEASGYSATEAGPEWGERVEELGKALPLARTARPSEIAEADPLPRLIPRELRHRCNAAGRRRRHRHLTADAGRPTVAAFPAGGSRVCSRLQPDDVRPGLRMRHARSRPCNQRYLPSGA